ncbi:MAG: CobW family GTP-binding protein [Bacteroidota bacterium]
MDKIKVNIITGFLGVGKTSAILNLLKNKPLEENWAILVNEFGEIAIDGHVLREGNDKNLLIKEISGGCMCCVGKTLLDISLDKIIHTLEPSRILIEPSGLGHVNLIISTLLSPSFKDKVLVMSPICLIDPRLLHEEQILDSSIFKDQVEYSEILLANKSGLREKDEIDHFYDFAKKFVPAKKYVSHTSHGRKITDYIDVPLTDFVANPPLEITGMFTDSATGSSNEKFLKKINENKDFVGVGWIFPPGTFFKISKLISTIHSLEKIIRLKGFLQTKNDWLFFNKTLYSMEINKTSPKKEGILEIIVPKTQKDLLKKFEIDLINSIDN